MQLRRFRAATLHGAMAQVRVALGQDALILATRRLESGVEVTAALDPPEPLAPARPSPASDRCAQTIDGEQIRLAQLDWHGVPVGLARRLRAGPLAYALSLALRFASLDLGGPSPILLVGPPGAGKTLTTVRLATRLVLSGLRPRVLCTDAARAGAGEQLAAFTRLLGIDLVEVAEPAEAGAVLRECDASGPVLIDSQGGNPWPAQGSTAVRDLAAATQARVAAVLPAGLDPAEAADLASGYAAVGAIGLIATRLDCARRLGGVLSAAATGLALVELGVGSGAADGLVPARPELLARRLLAPLPTRAKEPIQ